MVLCISDTIQLGYTVCIVQWDCKAECLPFEVLSQQVVIIK